MSRYWVTAGSTTVEAVANPLTAACTEWGYVPTHIFVLDNPGLGDTVQHTTEFMKAVVEAHGGDTPEVTITTIEDETDFRAVGAHYRAAIEEAKREDAAVAVDVTPGRKFMSAIAFQAGIQLDADHAFYLYVESGDLFGRLYPDLPRTATTLYDFTEVFA